MTDTTPITDDPTRRFDLRGRTLREHAARGAMVNTAFLVGLSGVGFVRSFLLAGFLTASDYGLWGITVIALTVIVVLRQVGVADRYIQQDEPDQELAFQRAFTVEAILSSMTGIVMLAAIPVFALIYDQPRMILPALLLVTNLAAAVLQMPLWTFYREMEFVKQRSLQAIEPLVSFVVAVVLAAAGAGYWALFIGATAGIWASAIAAVRASPYPLRLRYDRGTLGVYWRFSAPLLMANFAGIVIAWGALLATNAKLGLAAAGALTLASTISQFTDRVDGLVTGALYPAICSMKDRTELLLESFVKSNRLALMWAMPFGIGLSLFCDDLVNLALGERWRPALPLLRVFGVVAALGHIGFNWDAYFRARSETRPIAVAAGIAAVVFVAVGLPALLIYGLPGLAVGVGAQSFAHVACRAFFLRRLFSGFAFLRHASRAIVPSLPPAGLILLVRWIAPGHRTALRAVTELAAYIALTAVLTWAFERRLLREALGYLRPRAPAAA